MNSPDVFVTVAEILPVNMDALSTFGRAQDFFGFGPGVVRVLSFDHLPRKTKKAYLKYRNGRPITAEDRRRIIAIRPKPVTISGRWDA